jgi:hypothetical protein
MHNELQCFREKSFTRPAHSISHKSGESALILENFWKNNLNFVQDVPIIHVTFNITKLIFSEKKNGGIIFIPPPQFMADHSLALVKENRSLTIKSMLPTNQAQK